MQHLSLLIVVDLLRMIKQGNIGVVLDFQRHLFGFPVPPLSHLAIGAGEVRQANRSVGANMVN